jgi:hypothetical protein
MAIFSQINNISEGYNVMHLDFSVMHWHDYAFILSAVNASASSLTALLCTDIFIIVY